MLCPSCNVPLMVADRQGVEIDFCSACPGIWLDHGELDKHLERSPGDAPGRGRRIAGARPRPVAGRRR